MTGYRTLPLLLTQDILNLILVMCKTIVIEECFQNKHLKEVIVLTQVIVAGVNVQGELNKTT